MQHIVSITSQGQLTIPKAFLTELGIFQSTKAIIQKKGDTFLVRPKKDFWSLEGALKSKVQLTDAELKAARKTFGASWGKHD